MRKEQRTFSEFCTSHPVMTFTKVVNLVPSLIFEVISIYTPTIINSLINHVKHQTLDAD